jgi:hypothetical protein
MAGEPVPGLNEASQVAGGMPAIARVGSDDGAIRVADTIAAVGLLMTTLIQMALQFSTGYNIRAGTSTQARRVRDS